MNKRIMVVSAHPADWCTRAGGALLKYAEAGWDITVLVLTYGEHGESASFWASNPGTTVEACKRCREDEAREAAKYIGVKNIEFFDYGDYPMAFPPGEERKLGHRILELRPDLMFTHWPDDPLNMDHEVTGKAVTRAVSAAAMRGALPDTSPHFIPDIFFFEPTMPHAEFNHFAIDTYLDIGDVFDRKIAAVAKFKAQPQLIEFYNRCAINRGIQATDWSRGRGVIKHAEAYKRYTPYLGGSLPLTAL